MPVLSPGAAASRTRPGPGAIAVLVHGRSLVAVTVVAGIVLIVQPLTAYRTAYLGYTQAYSVDLVEREEDGTARQLT